MKTPMSDKTPAIRSMIESMFPDTAAAIAAKLCPLCRKPVGNIRLERPIYVREYEISGMCKSCQDKSFEG